MMMLSLEAMFVSCDHAGSENVNPSPPTIVTSIVDSLARSGGGDELRDGIGFDRKKEAPKTPEEPIPDDLVRAELLAEREKMLIRRLSQKSMREKKLKPRPASTTGDKLNVTKPQADRQTLEARRKSVGNPSGISIRTEEERLEAEKKKELIAQKKKKLLMLQKLKAAKIAKQNAAMTRAAEEQSQPAE